MHFPAAQTLTDLKFQAEYYPPPGATKSRRELSFLKELLFWGDKHWLATVYIS